MLGASRSQIVRVIPVLIGGCLFVFPAHAKYGGGSGTAQDPYRIAAAADLITLGETSADYDKHFVLTADIDLDPNLPGRKAFDKAVIAPDIDPANGLFQGTPFSGVFDGNGHTISHLTINGTAYAGLFGHLAGKAEVKNLGVVDVKITGSAYYVGALVGYNYNGAVTGCHATGAVSGGECVGGLVGQNWGGAVTGCRSAGAVSGTISVGGLAGENGGKVIQCYSSGSVGGSSSVGGLVGLNAGYVTNCYSTGAVNGDSYAGGLVAINRGAVTDCYTSAAVTGNSSIGGLVGTNGELVYSMGQLRYEPGSISNCYSTGAVRGGGSDVGGLVGRIRRGDVIASFWDTRTSGQSKSAGGTGKTTAEMRDPNTFISAGWDFVSAGDGPHDIWAEPEGGGCPILWWQPSPLPTLPGFSAGTGEPDDPYVISRPEELNSIGHNPRLMKCHFKLTENLDLKGLHFHPIGGAAYPYTGVFDGKGYTISHLTVMGSDYVGLFGQVAGKAEVKNLGVVDVNITGELLVGAVVAANEEGAVSNCHSTGTVSGSNYAGGLVAINWGSVTNCYSTSVVISASSSGGHVGGLVGQNVGSITHCYSTGAVGGWYEVGGLVGVNQGQVAQCYSTGAVSGIAQFVGGLVAYNPGGRVTSCYSTGAVSGTEDVGGLLGANYQGSVSRCYSTGAVRGTGQYVGGLVGNASPLNVIASFWDTRTSGQSKSAGGTGKTTAEMQRGKTFLDAGWDFVDETANGTEDIWRILEGKDYPRLWWEPIPEN